MARKMKGKTVRKAKGLKHSKRLKAGRSKVTVAKKSKPAQKKRATARAGMTRKRKQPDSPGSSMMAQYVTTEGNIDTSSPLDETETLPDINTDAGNEE